MRVETQNFSEYEGIFKCFSDKCEMVLELAHKVKEHKQNNVLFFIYSILGSFLICTVCFHLLKTKQLYRTEYCYLD